MIKYLPFKVLFLANYRFLPCFRSLVNAIPKKLFLLGSNPFIESIYNYCEINEMLLRKSFLHRTKQMVI